VNISKNFLWSCGLLGLPSILFSAPANANCDGPEIMHRFVDAKASEPVLAPKSLSEFLKRCPKVTVGERQVTMTEDELRMVLNIISSNELSDRPKLNSHAAFLEKAGEASAPNYCGHHDLYGTFIKVSSRPSGINLLNWIRKITSVEVEIADYQAYRALCPKLQMTMPQFKEALKLVEGLSADAVYYSYEVGTEWAGYWIEEEEGLRAKAQAYLDSAFVTFNRK
jgi:hypothetical protein